MTEHQPTDAERLIDVSDRDLIDAIERDDGYDSTTEQREYSRRLGERSLAWCWHEGRVKVYQEVIGE